MRIGVRWNAGEEPHVSVPDQLRDAIRQVDEDSLVSSWTLTWLEGLPLCSRSDGTVVRLTADGAVSVKYSESNTAPSPDDGDDDDWLLE